MHNERLSVRLASLKWDRLSILGLGNNIFETVQRL